MRLNVGMSLRCTVALGLLVSLHLPGEVGAADPFHEQLLATGMAAFERADYPSAVEDLQLACFGLLEEPIVLAKCLTYLAMSQAEMSEVPAFTRTVTRILEVEHIAKGFSSLDLRPDMRSSFDLQLEQWIPYETLVSSPVFRDNARRKRAAEIREKSPSEARVELEQRIISEPDHLLWRLLLAEINLAANDPLPALAVAEAALIQDPGLAAAKCIRGQANAALGDCLPALTDLDACDGSASPSRWVEIRVRCHIRLEAWDEAALLLAGLSADEQTSSPFRQLGKQIRKGKKNAPPAVNTTLPVVEEGVPSVADAEAPGGSVAELETAPEETMPVETMPVETSPPPPSVPEPSAERSSEPEADADALVIRQLEGYRALLTNGSRRQLDQAFLATRQIADQHPRLAAPKLLVAEIAYRLSRWQDAVSYFRSVEEIERLRSEHQFYLAVSLYEAGELSAARETLRLCVDQLEATDFVTRYSQKINGGAGQ